MTGADFRAALTDRARRAACAVAERHGVAVETPEPISFGSNVILRLWPHNMVARVSGVAARIRPNDDAAMREIAAARFLADGGAPVVPPSSLIAPGPHREDGLIVTFWDHVGDDGTQGADMEALAALQRCHAVLADYPDALPYLHGYAEARRLFLQLWRDNALGWIGAHETVHRLAALDEALAAMRGDADAPAIPLHGDAHLGNVLYAASRTGSGALWIDWEDVCTGPVEWDYACMIVDFRKNLKKTGRDAALIAAVTDDIDRARLDVMIEARSLQLDMWDAAVAALRDP